MQGLWSRGVFQKVLRTSLTPQDKVFCTRFHHKIKRKGGEYDKYKFDLLYKVNTWNEKAPTVLVITMMLLVQFLQQAVFICSMQFPTCACI